MAFKMKGSPMKRNFGIQFDITTKEGKDLLKQHKDIKTVRSSDVGRVTKNIKKTEHIVPKNISKLKKLKNLKNIMSITNPLGAISILGAVRKLNIKGGRGSDVYQKRKRNYMDLGKSQLNK